MNPLLAERAGECAPRPATGLAGLPGLPSAPVPDPGARPLRHFEPAPPVVLHERILRMQGYADMSRVRPAIASAAQAMARRAEALSRPAVAYQYRPLLALDDEGMELSGGARLKSRAFATRMTGCTQIAPFVLSCGMELGHTVVALADAGDLLEAVLLETAGWLCIEDATRQFKALLQAQAAARGMRITSRMGPGYAYRVGEAEVNWPLEDQVAFFALFGAEPLPVTLMSSCAMNPKLSRSGLYGVAPLHNLTHRAGRPGISEDTTP